MSICQKFIKNTEEGLWIVTHLPSCSITSTCQRVIEPHGPNGTASFVDHSDPDIRFIELPRLLSKIRQFHLDVTCRRELFRPFPGPVAFYHLSPFLALQTFTTERETLLCQIPPAESPHVFESCPYRIVVKELTRFASDCKNTASARLHHVVIIHRGRTLPSIVSIRGREERVPVIDVQIATKLSTDL